MSWLWEAQVWRTIHRRRGGGYQDNIWSHIIASIGIAAVIFFCKLGISLIHELKTFECVPSLDIAININTLAFAWFQSKYVFIVYPDIASTNGVFQAIHASVQWMLSDA